MSGVWPTEGRLTGRSAASGRLVDGDGGNGERGKIGCWKEGPVCGEEGALLLAGETKRKILMKEGGGLPRFGLCEQRQGGLRPPLVLSVFAPREGNGSFALCQGKALCASGSSFWFQRERGQPVQQGMWKKWGADYHSREGFWFLQGRGRPQGRRVMAPCVRRLVFGFFF